MTRILSLLFVGAGLVACTPPDESACTAGVREDLSGKVTTAEGAVDVDSSQCVSSAWEYTECEAGNPEFCYYMFEPNTPAKAPLELIFGDFVFRHSYGSMELSPPDVIAGAGDIQVGLQEVAEARVAEGYRASPVQPVKMFDGDPAYELTISCDHPDVDEICPFTWRYFIVDLDARAPKMYADYSIVYADFVDAGNVAAELPEEFADYEVMVDSIELSVNGD